MKKVTRAERSEERAREIFLARKVRCAICGMFIDNESESLCDTCIEREAKELPLWEGGES